MATPTLTPRWSKLLIIALLLSLCASTVTWRPTLAQTANVDVDLGVDLGVDVEVLADEAAEAEMVAAAVPVQQVQKYTGLGGVTARLVGPGPTNGSQRLYVSYLYYYDTFEIVAFDLATGAQQVFPSPLKSEWGAWAITTGPDGNIYVGTLPSAHLLRLDPRAGTFTDLGQPAPGEEYIWGLTVGSDGKIYGGTYPSAKLIRFDPATGAKTDLGRMHPTEMYLRPVMASTDGFIYGAVGFGKAHLVAYEIATGQHRDILPAAQQFEGTLPVLERGVDGRVFSHVNGQYLRLQGWQATPIAQKDVSLLDAGTRLRDGRVAWIDSGDKAVSIRDPYTDAVVQRVPVVYEGRPTPIFRLAAGPDGHIYGSTIMPLHLFRLDRSSLELSRLGVFGTGECYTFLPYRQTVLMGTYFGVSDAGLMVFDPRAPTQAPRPVQYAEQQSDWRPEAMIMGPNNEVLVGARAGYGKLGGPLSVWHPDTDKVETYANVVPDQDVVSLATRNGLVVGGTTTMGGSGAHATQTDARLFVWDPATRQKVFETVPVRGATKITDLIVAPNGLVYGFADQIMFVFDVDARRILRAGARLESPPIYNSIGVGPDGRLWGVAEAGVFVVDTRSNRVQLVGRSPEKVTAGFVLEGRDLYFAAQSRVFRYRLPG